MKHRFSLMFAALVVSASAAAGPHVSINVGISPFIFGGYAPPPVYQPPVYYAPPPVVYLGGGSWGGHDRRRGNPGRGHEEHGRRH